MNPGIRVAEIVALLTVIGGPVLHGASVELVSTQDAALQQFFSDNNLGGSDSVPAGSLSAVNGSGATNRALFRFDLTGQIPSNALVQSVTLTLRATAAPPPPEAVGSAFGLHRVLADWGEGTNSGLQGATAAAGEVTWNNRFHPGTAWSIAGGEAGIDYAAGAAAQVPVDAAGTYQWSSTPQLVADVQQWLENPSQNFGWLLKSQAESTPSTARRFATREHFDPAFRPRLVVHYELPAPVITNVASLGAEFAFSFLAEAGTAYRVEKLPGYTTTNWTLYSNVPAAPTAGSVVITDSLSASNSFYRVLRD